MRSAGECGKRGTDVPVRFAASEFWKERFVAFSKGKPPKDVSSFDMVCSLDVALTFGATDKFRKLETARWKLMEGETLGRILRGNWAPATQYRDYS